MHKVYVLLGSNIGDRIKNLSEALNALQKSVGKYLKASLIYETAAWGKEDQAAFLNQVIEFETSLLPAELLAITQDIENKLGRVRNEKWGARLIDIDILFYNDLILKSNDLELPHPQLHLRRFTLLPLAEIAPHLIHPVLKKTVIELLQNCPDKLEVKSIKQE